MRRPLGGTAVGCLAVLGVGQALWAYACETERQIELSEELYRPQLELGRWIEANVPEEVPILVDNIPGCWLDRREHARTLWTWFDVPDPGGEAERFGAWLNQEGIGYVLWFEEDWTQAPAIAPWLRAGEPVDLGVVDLVPLEEERSYGWVFYRVDSSLDSI